MTPGGELAKAALANEWTSPDSSATVLLAVAIDVLSPECLHWEPETIREQLESELGIKILQREMDRFLALRAALISDMAYQDVLVFHHTMNALNGSRIIFSAWGPVDLDELTWGLYELMLNDKPESDDAGNSGSHRMSVGISVSSPMMATTRRAACLLSYRLSQTLVPWCRVPRSSPMTP